MSEFHYVRTMGVDGGVDAVEGPAVGLDLETILKDGLPPFKVALEVLSALCEILDIADQDGEVHGDVTPRFVFLDETGAVSIEGFGAKRARSMAPERAPKGTATDLYGLGYTAFRLFAAKDMRQPLPEEPDAHDDAIIDNIVEVNFEDLPEEIVGDIQWYLAKLMSFEREERPAPVDVWRTLIAFADTVTGPRLDDWSRAAMNGGGERRDQAKAAQKPAAPPQAARAADPDEDLGGPVMQKGPLAKGGMNFDNAGKKGQATAFWSRDQMKAALENEDEEETYKPAAGGGSATNFWTRDQIQAMSEGRQDAPRPKRKDGGKNQTSFIPVRKMQEEEDLAAAGPPRSASGAPPKLGGAPPPPGGPPPKLGGAPPPPGASPFAGGSPPPVASSAPAARPAPQPASPFASQSSPASPFAQQAPQSFAEPDPEPASGGGGMKFVVIGVVVVLLLVCGGVLVLGGGGAILATMGGGSTAATAATDEATEAKAPANQTPKEEPEEEPEEAPKEEPKEEPKAATKSSTSTKSATSTSGSTSTKSSGTSTKSSGSSTSGTSTKSSGTATKSSAGSTSTTTTAPATGGSVRPKSTSGTTAAAPVEAAPTSGPVKVALKATGRGKLRCSDGSTPTFDGNASLEFDGSSLPVTCMVDIAGSKGVFQVDRASTVSCALSGDDVVCN